MIFSMICNLNHHHLVIVCLLQNKNSFQIFHGCLNLLADLLILILLTNKAHVNLKCTKISEDFTH